MLQSARRGLSLCAAALEHDGYLITASGETTVKTTASGEIGSGQAAAEAFSGALTKEDLEEAFMPAQIYKHKLWKNLSPHFADWNEQSLSAIQVLCALLSKTKAWTVFDQVVPNLENEAIALVGPALLNLGADPDFIADVWQAKFLDKYIKMSEEEGAKIRAPLQHMLEESMKGSFGMSEEAVDKALSSAPGKKELKRYLHSYFGLVRKFRGISTSGSLSKPLEIEGSLDAIKAFKEDVTAFGQELEAIGAITETVSAPLILGHLDAMMLKLTTLKQGNNTANQNALKKTNEAGMKLFRQVNVKTEAQFKADMRKTGSKMAAAQAGLKAVLKIVNDENPGIIDAASAATASGQTTASGLESTCAAALVTEATMTEYTCTFVAMTIAKNPKLKTATPAGKSLRSSLASALATLAKNVQANIFKTEVEKMQADLNDAEEANKG